MLFFNETLVYERIRCYALCTIGVEYSSTVTWFVNVIAASRTTVMLDVDRERKASVRKLVMFHFNNITTPAWKPPGQGTKVLANFQSIMSQIQV